MWCYSYYGLRVSRNKGVDILVLHTGLGKELGNKTLCLLDTLDGLLLLVGGVNAIVKDTLGRDDELASLLCRET